MSRYSKPSPKPIVYLGPSLRRSEAEQLLDADFRPPVKRGDLEVARDAATVVIIDGEFDQNFAASPKEILRLISMGVRVVGAASIGAVRAAELLRFGMEGYGWVFEAYNSGKIESDDEVALLFSPIDQNPLTVPLVNIRYWLEVLIRDKFVHEKVANRIMRHLKCIFYSDRTPEVVHDVLTRLLGSHVLQILLAATGGSIPDVKAKDARTVLGTVADENRIQSLIN